MSTNYSYGNKGITSCTFCNEELTVENPGKIAKRARGDKTFKETICNKCLLEDEYYVNDCELMDYPNEHDII